MQLGETSTRSREYVKNPELNEYPGDEALQIIKECRDAMGDNFAVVPLTAEFGDIFNQPEYAQCSLALADANRAHTFKARGAMVAVWNAIAEHDAKRVAAISAGNHAAGVALATDILGVKCAIFVPATTPPEKIANIRALNPAATIHQTGKTFEDAKQAAYLWELSQQGSSDKPVFIDPYDDPVVAAGQGTLIDDILAEKPSVTTIALPVGGGGLITGCLRRARQLGRHDIRFIGIEAEGSDSLSRSLHAGAVTEATHPNNRYGGSCVLRTGNIALQTCTNNEQLLLMTARDDAVMRLMQDYLRRNPGDTRRLYEPTSMVAVAGLMEATQAGLLLPGETVVLGTGRNAKLPQL